MNIWTFTGSLGKDCVIKATQGGTPVCEFSVAVNSGYGDKKKTTWAHCSLFGKRAEGKLPEFLKKGAKVAISGEATLEEWESKGQAHAMLKVAVNSLDLIGERPATSFPTVAQAEAVNGGALPAGTNQYTGPEFGDDIPFN